MRKTSEQERNPRDLFEGELVITMVIRRRIRAICRLACVVGLSAGIGRPAFALPPSGKAFAALKMDPAFLSWDNTLRMGAGFSATALILGPKRPAGIVREPEYRAVPLYGVLTVGNGPRAAHIVAVDEPDGADARIYIDLNGDGDLTNDHTGTWSRKVVSESVTTYSGTFVLRASYGSATRETGSAPYGLNLSRNPDRSALTYFRAAARFGKIEINGKVFEALLTEDENDGIFSKQFDPERPSLRGVWLRLGNDYEVDIRGTFRFAGRNYRAMASSDGSRLTMEPTSHVVKAPRPGRPIEKPLLAVGTEAPDFTAPMPGGGTFHLADMRGKVVVIDFWATWCGPCQKGLPHLQKTYERVKDGNVYVVAVNVWDDGPAYEKWVRANKQYTFPIARDEAGRDSAHSIASVKFQVSGIPTSYVIGADGKVVAALVGTGDEGDHRLDDALARAGVKL